MILNFEVQGEAVYDFDIWTEDQVGQITSIFRYSFLNTHLEVLHYPYLKDYPYLQDILRYQTLFQGCWKQ